MLLESFKANSDSGYVIVPIIKEHSGYLAFIYKGMCAAEIAAWKSIITVPEVRAAHAHTEEDYLKVIQALGIRSAISGTDACRILRQEYHSTPLYRRLR